MTQAQKQSHERPKLKRDPQVQIRMNPELKEEAEIFFAELGLNMSTAFTIFVKQSLREGAIPFRISCHKDDFYNEFNQKRILKSIRQIKEGKGIEKTMAELEAMENE